MKKFLPSLTAFVLLVALFGCSGGDCTEKVHAGSAGSTGVYTDSEGTQHQITADSNGDVTVPCGTNKDTISMVNSAQ